MGLVLICVGLLGYKVLFSHYSLASIVPISAFDVHTSLRFEGHEGTVRVRTFLPRSDRRQRVGSEVFGPSDLTKVEEVKGPNRIITWRAESLTGPRTLSIDYRVWAPVLRYELPADVRIARELPENMQQFLAPTATIQSDSPEIAALLDRLAPRPRTLKNTLQAIFTYTHHDIEPMPFKGTTDALTALRLGQGSCTGKSRLFAALARHAGLPTRLVGGLILNPGSKRTSHQWVETWINGQWVPFCPLNEHFAEIPAQYLRLYTGDEALFTH
ncbi:MAG: transglutaminase family protein, partial [Acidobacteriota bacterium]